MLSIVSVLARQILDSRGNPTIETEVLLSDGSRGVASVPSGASTGTHEALELRDKDPAHFEGKGVIQAIAHVNGPIAQALANNDPLNQLGCDNELVLRDATSNLHTYGANAILSVSLAISKAAAISLRLPYFQYLRRLYNLIAIQDHRHPLPAHVYALPLPMFNVMNGGVHTHWQTIDFQECMIVPVNVSSFAQALEWGSEIYHALEHLLTEKGLSVLVGDEGGFAPQLHANEEALELIVAAIAKAGRKPGIDVRLALDPATSELYEKDHYQLRSEKITLTAQELVDRWQTWAKKYPIMSLEDGLAEDDWAGWSQLYKQLHNQILLVGDDLLVTNPQRITQAIHQPSCNALLVKVNQIGTLSETLQAIQLARSAGWRIIVSHRSGETEDTAIADLAVGVGAEFVKMGAPARTERTAKYNQLLRIEEQLTQG